MNSDTGLLIASRNRSRVFFVGATTTLFHPFSFFFCGRRFYHCASRRPQHRESCDVGIRRVGSSIFRPTSRKNILKDSWRPSRGSKGGRRGFFIPRTALNSASQCQDGISYLKNAVELREYKLGQCVDGTNVCINLYCNKFELCVTLILTNKIYDVVR